MNRTRVISLLIVFVMFGVLTIAVQPSPVHGSPPASIVAPHGLMPQIVHHADQQTVDAYSAALTAPEVLRAVPCTCGCVKTLGHETNFDCYVDEINADTVSFSTHGLYCYICQVITRDAVAGAADGMSADELHRMIVDRYEHGG